MGYTLINRDDPSVESFREAFFKIRRALGTTAIGINEVRFPPGGEGPDMTSSIRPREIYIVLEGSGTFTIDGEAVLVGVGDYLRVDADAKRQAAAGPEGLTRGRRRQVGTPDDAAANRCDGSHRAAPCPGRRAPGL